MNAILLYIPRDGTQDSLSGTAVKTVSFLVSLLFMDRLRFTLSNRDRTRLYEFSIITILYMVNQSATMHFTHF